MGVAALGMIIYHQLVRHHDVSISLLSLESRFADRLRPFGFRAEQPPEPKSLTFPMQALFLFVPLALLEGGAIRAFPVLGLPVLPVLLTLIGSACATRATQNSPRGAWRLLLAGWVNARALICHPGFIAIGLFFVLHTAVLLLQTGRDLRRETLADAIQLRLPTGPRETQSSSLQSVGMLLQEVVKRPDFMVPGPIRLDILRGVWWFLAAICGFLFAWDAKSFWDWARYWSHSRSNESSSPAIPSLRLGSWSGRGKGLTLAWLFSAGMNNIFHLLLTVEICSVLIRGRALFSRALGETIGWIVLDHSCAAQGIYQASTVGTVFVVILMFPTLSSLIACAVPIAGGIAARLKHRTLPASPSVLKTASGIAEVVGVRCPRVYATAEERPNLQTRFPWFFGRPRILISRGALGLFENEEMKAAIAHEMVHVKYDAPAIRWTRWASFLCLYPCNVFAILLDTDSREMRADREAISLAGSEKYLVSAIVKASIGSVFRRQGATSRALGSPKQDASSGLGRRWQGLRRNAGLLVSLCQPDLILGYAHPLIEDRLQAIRQDGGRGDPQPEEASTAPH